MNKSRIAIVVQRSHPRALGGSEAHAMQYAQLLKTDFEVHILTTCAIESINWHSELKPGLSIDDDIITHRFENKPGHSEYWKKLHARLVSEYRSLISYPGLRSGEMLERRLIDWPDSLQAEWVRAQGPHSPDLLQYLILNHIEYKYFIFLTYLYSPTCFGLGLVPKEKAFLVPTLHDEPASRLPIYKGLAQGARKLFWNTGMEKKLAEYLWGKLDGCIMSMYVNTDLSTNKRIEADPYFLYLGRIEHGKGCLTMIEYYLEALGVLGFEDKLVLAGSLEMQIPNHGKIYYKGFVNEKDKFNLIKNATALIMPSANESLSIVTLEAMAQLTPVISNKKNKVLLEHIDNSGCDFGYLDKESFLDSIKKVKSGAIESELNNGRRYVLGNYSKPIILKRLLQELV